ncbi:MAG: thioredoxin, partial [Muribaculaceae bacterium]|nr:thioredoxin [Muribaculaceae bacterium]
MKKISLVLGACALLAACSPTRPDAVDNPDVLASNASSSLDLTRVEMTDTSTVLRFNVNFRPGWWIRINENSYIIADGDTLPLVSAEGIVPGTEHTMPESGEDSFSLTFGPISPQARSLTF